MCPFDCYNGGDQGICVDGTCQCNQPYLPPFCAFANSPIISNQTTNGTINTNGYTYYQFEMGSLNQINIQLQITTTAYNGTAALILNNGNAIPDVTNYDYLNQTENGFAELQVEISNEAIYSNNWEIGIYCNTSCNFTVLYVASYVCPNDCSGNGFCSQQTQNCQCYENFILPDCSMQMTAIGTKTNLDFISSTGWNYFNFNITSAGDQLNITVNSLSGNNLQVYVSQYEPPTIYKYNKYFQTMNTNQVIINNPSSSLWYIGIFSISPSNYSLFTDYKLICPNDCNGNGDCGSNGICDCYSPYQDLDCSLYNQTLTEGSPVSGEVINPGSINYYYFPVLQPKTAIYFNIRLQQKVPGKNPKLYLSYNKVPNPYIFDYISFNDGNYERIVVMRDSSQVGIWNCAVYIPSFQNDSIAFTYQIVASTSLYCPNNCSGNGICLDTGICKCNPNYQLEDCSFYLVKYNNSAIIEDMSNQTEWHYYELEVVDINQITVSVTVNYTNTVLYLRYNQLPDLMFYNRRSQVNSSMHDWTLTNETFYSGTWYLGIHKPKGIPVNYIVSFSNNSVCVNNCTSPQHGKCINNKCVCNENFVLNDCSAPNFPIFSGQAVNGEISSEEWNFYYISVQGENALIITLEELNTSYLGNIWVYVEENNYPSTKNFAFSNTDISKIHTIYINSSIAGGGKNWIIGVFGSPKMGYNLQSVRYNISADTGCNGYGVCSLCVEDPNCGWCHSDPLNATVGSCYGGTSNGPSHQECKFVWSFSTCSTKSTRDKNLLVGLYAGVGVGLFIFLVLVFLFITAYRINKNKKKFHYKRISALN